MGPAASTAVSLAVERAMITAGGFMLRANPAGPNAGRFSRSIPCNPGKLFARNRLPDLENRTGDIPTTDYLSILPPQNVIAMDS